ncbi:MAG: hypothetical protein Q4A07_12470 [Coriobacteriales bacterium]|nr:hypothetical protein [Coriobacteriales bacterium]
MDAKDAQAVARAANIVSDWCALRDVPELTEDSASLFVLFGGAIIGSVDVLAHAMRRGVACCYAIVGGRGHATNLLDESVARELSQWDYGRGPAPAPGVDSEARMLEALLAQRWGLHADLLEGRSTNCGNNITFLLDMLDERGYVPKSVVLCQDAVMQRRMDATWRRQVRDRPCYANVKVINWASYQPRLVARGASLEWAEAPEGMWPIEAYLNLLVGEVARLTNDEQSYGPRGRDFVVPVEVSNAVREAAEVLKRCVDGAGRVPDDRYARAKGE